MDSTSLSSRSQLRSETALAPDLSYIEASGADLARFLRAGATVVLESTTYPGTTEELLVPILEAWVRARSCERRLSCWLQSRAHRSRQPGLSLREHAQSRVRNHSRSAWRSSRTSTAISSPRRCRCPSTKEAELTKLLENTFRHVNIALINELAMFAAELDIDIWAAISKRPTPNRSAS